MTSSRSMRTRALAFALVVAACLAGIAGYARHVARQANASAATAAPFDYVPVAAVPDSSGRPFVMFRSTALGASYGHVTLARIDDPAQARQFAPISCDRVHYAGGTGICLVAERGALTVYRAILFDDHFAIRKKLDLAGPPSRARVSPDGSKAAFTVFINGHAYSNPGFTTRTSIVDATSGASLVDDLETWPVVRDGAPFKAADFNFWGVTFAHDGPRFYATLGSGGRTWLVEGDLATHQMRVVASDVECPSLSPDGKRIAFKRRATASAGGRILWHVAVLDLASGKVAVLASEARSVDDQVEWNGDDEILYGMPLDSQQSAAETDVWAIAADGSQPPHRLLPFAFSPAVVR
jgi:hypothetical protein